MITRWLNIPLAITLAGATLAGAQSGPAVSGASLPSFFINEPLSSAPLPGGVSITGSTIEHVFVQEAGGHIHELISPSPNQWNDQDDTAPAHGMPAWNSPMSSFYNSNDGIYEHVFFLDGNGHVHEMYSDTAGGWHDQDNTGLYGGAVAKLGTSLPSFYNDTAGVSYEHVFFVDLNEHVHEMYSDSEGRWTDQDITSLYGGTLAWTIPLTAFYAGGASPEHVFFQDGSAHLHEMYSDSTGRWHDRDTATTFHVSLTEWGTPLTSFYSGGASAEHVFFLDTNRHIHEMYSDRAGDWQDQDTTVAANGAEAWGTSLTAFYEGGSSPEYVFYLDVNSHVHEMHSDTARGWTDQDITALYGGTASVRGSGLSSFYTGGAFPEHVFFEDFNGNVHEMYSDTAGHWYDHIV